MKILKSKILRDLCTKAFAVFVLVAFAFISHTLAWTSPSAPPTGGNSNAPFNADSATQTKVGGLVLNAGNAEYGLVVPFGKVGIGTNTPSETLEVVGDVRAVQAHIDQVCDKTNPTQCLTFTQMYNYVHP